MKYVILALCLLSSISYAGQCSNGRCGRPVLSGVRNALSVVARPRCVRGRCK